MRFRAHAGTVALHRPLVAPVDVFEGGEILAPTANDFGIDFGGDDFFGGTGIGEDVAVGIDDEGAAGIDEFGIGAGAIDADNVGEVFDGAGLEERDPMLFAFVGPVGDDDIHFRALADGRAKNFGEAKVVTNERRDFEGVPFEEVDRLAAVVMIEFFAESEGMDFGVAG